MCTRRLFDFLYNFDVSLPRNWIPENRLSFISNKDILGIKEEEKFVRLSMRNINKDNEEKIRKLYLSGKAYLQLSMITSYWTPVSELSFLYIYITNRIPFDEWKQWENWNNGILSLYISPEVYNY